MTTLLLLQQTYAQDVKIESLDDGPGILPFKLGPTRITSHYHSFLQYIDLQELQNKITSVQTQIHDISPDLNNKTLDLFEPHINYLKDKLQSTFDQLQTFKTKREKRGLIDGLGSVIKSLTGNLDYTDAQRYDNALKLLKDNENEIVTELNNHISLSKDWTEQYTKIIKSISDNQDKIEILLNKIKVSDITRDNDLIKYAHLAQVFIILTDNVESVSQEINKLQDALAFIKIKSMHHSILSLDSLRTMIDRLIVLYNKNSIIDLDTREYYDIIGISSFYSDNKVVIVYKFPLVLPQEFSMFKLSIIPNKYNQVLIPPHPFLVIHKKDARYIVAECPKLSKGYLCEEEKNIQISTSKDCIQQLIITQQREDTCQPTSVSLEKTALEQLDDQHYTIYFPNTTKVHLSCGQDLYNSLQGSFLISIPHSCYIETPDFIISNSEDHLKGHPIKIMNIPTERPTIQPLTSSLKLNTIRLEHLQAANLKVSQQQLLNLTDENRSLYHTTIPIYTIILAAFGLIIGIAYRRYKFQQMNTTEESTEDTTEIQGVYAVPKERRVETPAQFTTRLPIVAGLRGEVLRHPIT